MDSVTLPFLCWFTRKIGEREISRGFIQQSLDTDRHSLSLVVVVVALTSSMRFRPADRCSSIRIRSSRRKSKSYGLRRFFLRRFFLLKSDWQGCIESGGMKYWVNDHGQIVTFDVSTTGVVLLGKVNVDIDIRRFSSNSSIRLTNTWCSSEWGILSVKILKATTNCFHPRIRLFTLFWHCFK